MKKKNQAKDSAAVIVLSILIVAFMVIMGASYYLTNMK